MPLTISRRANGIFRIRGTHYGVKVERSAHTRDRAEAQAVRAKIERDIFERQVHGKTPERTFAEAVTGYLKGGGEARYLVPLLPILGVRALNQIDQTCVDDAALTLYPGRAPSTIARQVHTPVLAVMSWAVKRKWTTPVIIDRPRQAPGRLDWRTPEEIERYIGHARSVGLGALADAIIVMVATMMRSDEAVRIDEADIAGDGSRIVLWKTKSRRMRSVEPLARARPILAGDYHWPWETRSGFQRALEKLSRGTPRRPAASPPLPHIHAHVMRHTGATWRYALRPDLPTLMAQGGWTSADMALRYTHAATPDLAARIRAFGWDRTPSAP